MQKKNQLHPKLSVFRTILNKKQTPDLSWVAGACFFSQILN